MNESDAAPSKRNIVSENTAFRPVKRLSPDVARKIAAGEVIDRPAAVLREFLDNALDAGAQRIIAETESGGISFIRVADNGCGMSKADLEECAHPHATSKIISDIDLERLSTLGFRGEALASIAAVSRLEITSSRGGEAWKMYITGTERHIEPASLPAGTTAICRGLFENFPARHRFLKRPQAENLLCKQTFIEKTLPFPDKAFRLICDGKVRLDLPANQSLSRRFCSALEMSDMAALFNEIHSENRDIPADEISGGFYFSIVLGETSVYRSDRKLMYVFVNGRRVQEYALLQALDYGAEGYFPNGTHPAACLFLTIDSSLVDFNIHPAKKEVRFKDITPVHRSISSAVRNFYRNLSVHSLAQEAAAGITLNNEKNTAQTGSEQHFDFFPQKNGSTGAAAEKSYTPAGYGRKQAETHSPHTRNLYNLANFDNTWGNLKTDTAADSTKPGTAGVQTMRTSTGTKNSDSSDIRYIGTALGVFLIAEKNNNLYLVDQHAGHERILFERFMESSGQKQSLLIPLVIETPSAEDDAYLESILPELEKAGFTVQNRGGGRWEAESVPIKWQGGERDLQSDLLDKRIRPEELIRSLAASTACRAAVKDGNVLDPQTAQQFLCDIFSLEDPHCPHGRPIWIKISKEDLFRAVKRIQ